VRRLAFEDTLEFRILAFGWQASDRACVADTPSLRRRKIFGKSPQTKSQTKSKF
jgi:hypothetical protein